METLKPTLFITGLLYLLLLIHATRYNTCISFLLDLIQNDFKEETELLCLAIGALRNVLLDSPVNRGRCADADGLLILTNIYFASTNNDVKQQCLGALKNLVGNSW